MKVHIICIRYNSFKLFCTKLKLNHIIISEVCSNNVILSFKYSLTFLSNVVKVYMFC